MKEADDTIMRINSGLCRITGKTIEPNGNVINDDIFLAFDYKSQLYRFDNGNLKRSLLSSDYFYEVWHLNTDQVSVKRSPIASPEVTSQFCRIVDIQNIFRFVPIGTPSLQAYQKSSFHLKNKEIITTNYEELSSGLVKVTTCTPSSVPVPEYTEYIMDTKNGFTIKQVSRSIGYIFELSWSKINETWVPVSYVFKSGPKNGNFGVEWKIDWEQVNEKVDSIYFDVNEMLADQKEGAVLFSDVSGTSQPKIISKIGKTIAPIQSVESSPRSQRIRFFLMITGFVIIAFAMGKKYYAWKQGSTHE